MKKEKRKNYIYLIFLIFLIFLILFFTISLLFLFALPVNAGNQPPQMQLQSLQSLQSETAVVIDADTGQVLFEKNMNQRMYPASVTKIMTALLAFERGSLSDIITMSYDAVWSIGRDTSNIALDVDEQITLEQALYALSIESANDAANGIAELISGSMDEFAKLMTRRAKELGAKNTNFVNAHGLQDVNHYTSAYDLALILAADVKIPEFTKIFTTVTYSIPPTNKQPLPTPCNRKNSLIEGPYHYDGIIGEKTGWTSDSGFTYAAAARRGGKTLVAVVMRAPNKITMWQDTTALLNYGFNEFEPVRFNAAEFSKEQYIFETANGNKINMSFTPAGDFNCLILKSLNKDDIEINYTFDTFEAEGGNEKIGGKAVFSLKPELSSLMFGILGEIDLQIIRSEEESPDERLKPVNNTISTDSDRQEEPAKKKSIFSVILSVLSVILQIIGIIALILLFLYIRRNRINEKRKRQRKINQERYDRYKNMRK